MKIRGILGFIVFLVILISPCTFGQDYDLTEIDVSNAVISIAGPKSLFIRSVQYGTEEVSFLLEAVDPAGQKWKVKEIFTGATPMIPDNVYLDFAEISSDGGTGVEISGIILDGESYTAYMKILDAETLEITEYPLPGEPSYRYTQVLQSLKKSLLAAEQQQHQEQISTLENKITLLEDENTTSSQKIVSLNKENKQYEDAIISLNQENKQYENQIEELQSAVSDLEEGQGSWKQEMEVLSRVNEELKVTFQETIEKLRQSISVTETSAAPEPEGIETAGASKPLFNKVLLTGFGTGRPQMGRWHVTDTEIIQKDETQYFAKYVLSIKQTEKPTLFSFHARSSGEGWVGLGMHFYASGNNNKLGYGYGNSLLFWLTRDPKYYGTRDTHAQLYKSNDSVNMAMVLNSIIEEDISDDLKIDILYEPAEEYFTVFINEEEKLKYKTWFNLDRGMEIAFRTLGGGSSFSDLAVKTIQ